MEDGDTGTRSGTPQEAGAVAIDALQMQVAFLEDTVASLDKALVEQQNQLQMLTQQVRHLHTQLKEQGHRLDAVNDTADTPPPHY